MKHILNLILLFSILLSTTVVGQNLVPNPSFEQLRNLPIKPNPKNSYIYDPLSGYKPFIYNLNFWFAATAATPDIRIVDRDRHKTCYKRFGEDCDKARTGEMAVGILTFHQNEETDSYREYIEIKLKKPLRPDNKTFIEFWVKKEMDAKLVSNNLGGYFSMKKVYADILEPISVEPHFNCTRIINAEQSEWVKIEGEFTPNKAFEFLTIGNFFQNDQTETITYPNYKNWRNIPPYAYYMIDDVRVWQAGDAAPVEDSKPILFEEKAITVNKPIRLHNILFDFGKASLQASSFETLERLVFFLKENPTITIAIHGHTDNIGNSSANLQLSIARAKAVFDFLQTKGVDGNRLQFEGYGESRPLVENSSEAGKEQNRRVEFVVQE